MDEVIERVCSQRLLSRRAVALSSVCRSVGWSVGRSGEVWWTWPADAPALGGGDGGVTFLVCCKPSAEPAAPWR